MKKLLTALSLVLVLLVGTVGCADRSNDKLVIAVPDGAPSLAVYTLLAEKGGLEGYDVKFEFFSGPDTVASEISGGLADIVVLPTNVASKLYNKGTDVKLLSVNIFGVLYMIGTENAASFSDLKGKVVCNIGRGGTPDLTLKLLLDANQVPYEESDSAIDGKVALTYVSEASNAMALKTQGKCDYLVLGEPVVTQANAKLGTHVVFDLQAEWAKAVGADSYMQAGVVINKRVYENEKLVEELTAKLSANKDYIKSHYAEVKGVLTESGSSIKVDFTEDTVSRLNVGFTSAKDAKTALETYFNAIAAYDATFIGGKLPDDGFYYGYEA